MLPDPQRVTVSGAATENTRHLTASAVVLDRGTLSQVLLVHHNAEGKLMFPGGHLEVGEDPASAAVREVLEETGVLARIVCQPDVPQLPDMRLVPTPWIIREMPAPGKPDRPGKPAEAPHRHLDMLFIADADMHAAALRPAPGEVSEVMWAPVDGLESLPVRGEVPTVARLAQQHAMNRGPGTAGGGMRNPGAWVGNRVPPG